METGEYRFSQYLFFRYDSLGKEFLDWTCSASKGRMDKGRFCLPCGIVRFSTFRVTRTPYDREAEVARGTWQDRRGVFGKYYQPCME